MSGLVDRIRRVASGHPRLFAALRTGARCVLRGYWRVREELEPAGIWLKTKLFWPLRLKWHVAVAATVARLAIWRMQGDCILSFLGLRPRLTGPVDLDLVVMVAFADIRHDPRIEREARALAQAGFRLRIVFPKTSNWDDGPVDWGSGVSFMPVVDRAGLFCTRWPGFIGDELFLALLQDRPFAIHAHDLNMAFIAFAAARRTGAKVVCDFHEWYSENVTYDAKIQRYSAHSSAWHRGYRWLERYCLAHADAVVTVCDSIADAMASELGEGRRPVVVRNIPSLLTTPTRDYLPLKQELGLPESQFVLLYQGGLGPSRFIEPVIEALAHAPGCLLVIRGPQMDLWGSGYRQIAEKGGFSDRLLLRPALPSRDVVAAARGADAGVWTLPRLCRNFTYALPNKIFEYTASNLPLLVADYPEARRMVEAYQMGLTFDPYDPSSIAAAINRLVEDRALGRSMAVNTNAALEAMDAGREWQRMAEIYQRLRADVAAKRAA